MPRQCYGVDEQTDRQTAITTLYIDTEKQKSLLVKSYRNHKKKI